MKPIAAFAMLALALPQPVAAACRSDLADPAIAIPDPGGVKIERIFPGADLLAEAILSDPANGRTLLSGRQGIFALAADGALEPWAGTAARGQAVGGLALDEAGDSIWAIVTALGGEENGRSAVIRLARGDGRLIERIPLPGVDQWYGDLAFAPDGAVYVGNPRTGALYRVRPGAPEPALIVPPGRIRSPQGMIVAPGGARLIVADYARGLAAVDLHTNAVTRIAAPTAPDLTGIDGIVAERSGLVAFQNGTAPFRVLRLVMDGGLSEVRSVTTLAEFSQDPGQLVEPTLGAASARGILFVARTSWSAGLANARTLVGLVCAAN